jgi:hypothetical protein
VRPYLKKKKERKRKGKISSKGETLAGFLLKTGQCDETSWGMAEGEKPE